MGELLKPLGTVRMWSKKLQSDAKPTIHLCTAAIMSISNLLKVFPAGYQVSAPVAAFCKSMNEELNKVRRCPDMGRKVLEYNAGNFLHPKFKGNMLQLNQSDAFENLMQHIKNKFKPIPSISSSDSLQAERIQSVIGSQSRLNEPLANSMWTIVDQVAEEAGFVSESPNRPDKSPIELELNR